MDMHIDAAVIAAEATAKASTPPDIKRPLHRELPPPSPYPVQALGSLRPAAEAIHNITQAPLAICAQSVLAVGALAIQAHRDVDGPIGRRPLSCLFASIAESGERKSAADRLALSPVHKIEREWRDQAEIEAATYKDAKEAWDQARAYAKRKAKGDKAAMLDAFNKIGPEPRAPRSPMLLVSDATPEAIVLHLADGRPWGGQFTAEGGLVHRFHEIDPLQGIPYALPDVVDMLWASTSWLDIMAAPRRVIDISIHYCPEFSERTE